MEMPFLQTRYTHTRMLYDHQMLYTNIGILVVVVNNNNHDYIVERYKPSYRKCTNNRRFTREKVRNGNNVLRVEDIFLFISPYTYFSLAVDITTEVFHMYKLLLKNIKLILFRL